MTLTKITCNDNLSYKKGILMIISNYNLSYNDGIVKAHGKKHLKKKRPMKLLICIIKNQSNLAR